MIKIIKGYYGYKNGNSIIPKCSKDAPFSCDKAEEARLVKLGVAEYVKAEANEGDGLDKEALIARYKELGLAGNPASWKAETIAKKIKEAEAEANEGDGEDESNDDESNDDESNDDESNDDESNDDESNDAPDFGDDDGVVE